MGNLGTFTFRARTTGQDRQIRTRQRSTAPAHSCSPEARYTDSRRAHSEVVNPRPPIGAPASSSPCWSSSLSPWLPQAWSPLPTSRTRSRRRTERPSIQPTNGHGFGAVSSRRSMSTWRVLVGCTARNGGGAAPPGGVEGGRQDHRLPNSLRYRGAVWGGAHTPSRLRQRH